MKNKLKVILVVVAVAAAGFGGYTYFHQDDANTKPATVVTNEAPAAGTIQFSADKKQVTYTGETGKTALENLQTLTAVETKSSSFGDMVVGINGQHADDGKNYWAFYVNDAYANEGAGTYKTKDGDKLMWRLEDIQ